MGRHSEQPSLTATPVDGHANGTRCHVPGRDIALFVDRSEDRSAEHAYGDEPAAQKVDGIWTDVDSVILVALAGHPQDTLTRVVPFNRGRGGLSTADSRGLQDGEQCSIPDPGRRHALTEQVD